MSILLFEQTVKFLWFNLLANKCCGNKTIVTIVRIAANNVNNVILKILLIIFFNIIDFNLKFDVSGCHDSQRPGLAAVAHLEFSECSQAERCNLFLERREAAQSHGSKPMLAAVNLFLHRSMLPKAPSCQSLPQNLSSEIICQRLPFC